MLTLVKCSVGKLTARLGGIFCDDKQIVGFNLYKRGVKREAGFSKDHLDQLVSQDKFIGFVGFFSAEPNNEDPSFTTSALGDRYQTTPGAVRWTFSFGKGTCFHKQLYKLNASEDYEITFVDSLGRELVKVNKDGTFSGFKVKLFVGNRNIKLGAEDLTSTLMVDLLAEEIENWNLNAQFIESDDIDFKEINPIAELSIEVPNLVAGQTTTTILVTNACSDAQVTGLNTLTNWKIERNGVLEAPTAITSLNGSYTFTHTAFNANDKIRFLTNVSGYPVYPLDFNYYVGASNIEIVS